MLLDQEYDLTLGLEQAAILLTIKFINLPVDIRMEWRECSIPTHIYEAIIVRVLFIATGPIFIHPIILTAL
jgi:hypothetical protein